MGNRILVNGVDVGGFNGKIQSTHAMIGESLSADQFTFDVDATEEPFIAADEDHPFLTADDKLYFTRSAIDPASFKDGDEVLCYSGETLLGKYYFSGIKQIGATRYEITALSIVGKLLSNKHYGGIYASAPASSVLASILAGLNYTIAPEIAAATVTGYLPIDTRRNNLQQVLLHTGATMKSSASGKVSVEPMSSVQTGVFDAERCFGTGSIETTTPVVGVKLTEHNYIQTGNVVTLYSDGIDGTETLEFSEPYHDYAITGGTIVESGANYAKITAHGTVTLTGKPYTHVTRIVTAGTVDNVSTENVKSIENCYLSSPQVAQAIAERFLAYYQCNQVIRQDVIVGTELAGDVVSVLNPDTQLLTTATIQSFSVNMSTVNKASVEFLANFIPKGTISGFANYKLLTGSGTWSVPSGVSKIRVIAVGAGNGASGGKRGAAGADSNEDTPGEGGTPGKAGSAGQGGKVFEISLDVTSGKSFSYACGTHGAGGKGETSSVSQSDGTSGGETTFGAYSSAQGRLYPYGYYEPKTGLTLAANGAAGYDGGRGGDGSANLDAYASPMVYGQNGGAVQGYSGGRGGPTVERELSDRHSYQYAGGGGGGAANGAAGADAASWKSKSANGGAGATGAAGESGKTYGAGGSAGNGGGGGGGAGIAYDWDPLFTSAWLKGLGGAPGNGTDGGDGVDGCIIIYY